MLARLQLLALLLPLLVSISQQAAGAERVSVALRHIIEAKAALEDLSSKGALATHLKDYSGLFPKAHQEISLLPAAKVLTAQMQTAQQQLDWIPAFLPHPEDHGTVTSFALMAANSYIARSHLGRWYNFTDDAWRDVDGFGWNNTGLRGHIFLDQDERIAVISFKGTSTLLGGGETVARDKYMDNIMFSCCCARVDLSWTPVCGCYKGTDTLWTDAKHCDVSCLEETIQTDANSYYREALAVTQVVLARYPRVQLLFTGHSLGGAIAALMAVSVRKSAAITFASPGASKYARHMGLMRDRQESSYPIWNFGLSSDPIYMGTCTGLVSSCYLSGYALETRCRMGMDCTFQVQSWQPDVATHRINWMIDNILAHPHLYPLPICKENTGCIDCPNWAFTRN